MRSGGTSDSKKAAFFFLTGIFGVTGISAILLRSSQYTIQDNQSDIFEYPAFYPAWKGLVLFLEVMIYSLANVIYLLVRRPIKRCFFTMVFLKKYLFLASAENVSNNTDGERINNVSEGRRKTLIFSPQSGDDIFRAFGVSQNFRP